MILFPCLLFSVTNTHQMGIHLVPHDYEMDNNLIGHRVDGGFVPTRLIS